MTFTVGSVMRNVRSILNDADNVHWTLPEVLSWVNSGVRAMVVHKPTITSDQVEVLLTKGTRQQLAANHAQLLEVHRNLTTLDGSAAGRAGGKIITSISRRILDAQIPGWQNPSVLPYSAQVDHVIQELDKDPRTFYVVPGNTGAGVIEATVSVHPPEVAAPNNPLDISSYTMAVPLIPDIYQDVLMDYVLYRCFSKDSNVPNSAGRAAAHKGLFDQALGVKRANEAAANVNTPAM